MRWLAALCVALVALVYLEPVHASEHSAPDHGMESVLVIDDGHYVHAHDPAPEGTGHDRIPHDDSTEPHAHHCVGGHAACLRNDDGLSLTDQATLRVRFTLEDSAQASRPASTLDRPPRPLALS